MSDYFRAMFLRRTKPYPTSISIARIGSPSGYSGIGGVGAGLRAIPASTQPGKELVRVAGKFVGEDTGSDH